MRFIGCKSERFWKGENFRGSEHLRILTQYGTGRSCSAAISVASGISHHLISVSAWPVRVALDDEVDSHLGWSTPRWSADPQM